MAALAVPLPRGRLPLDNGPATRLHSRRSVTPHHLLGSQPLDGDSELHLGAPEFAAAAGGDQDGGTPLSQGAAVHGLASSHRKRPRQAAAAATQNMHRRRREYADDELSSGDDETYQLPSTQALNELDQNLQDICEMLGEKVYLQ